MHSVGRLASVVAGLLLSLSAIAADKMPSWMADPPKDDGQFWYGTGEGPDLEIARRGALRNVAAKLRSTIAGQVSNTTTASTSGGKEKVSMEATNRVVEEVAKTEFTRFDVVQSTKGGIGVYALVRVDRPAFIADTRNKLQVVDKPVSAAAAALPGQTTLDQYLSLRRLKKQIEDGVRMSLLLQGAGATEEGQAGYRRYSDLLQAGADTAYKLTFELRAPPADADIASAVSAYLAELGMRAATTRTPGDNPLTISSDSRQDELYGSKMLKMKVRLAVLDEQGRAVASNEFDIPGSSRYDFKGARDDAVKKLADALRKGGPLVAFGFKD